MFNMQHIKRKYLVYRNKNFDVPDEVIESTLELEPEVLVRLRHDDTVDRVDLEIHQIFTWSDYLAFAHRVADHFKGEPVMSDEQRF